MIIHITTSSRWETAQSVGIYAHESLYVEGFIHCSKPEQVLGSARKHFPGQKDLLLLSISPEKVTAPIVYEDSYQLGQDFPHIYGELNLDAVDQVIPLPIDEDGLFRLSRDLFHEINGNGDRE